MVRKSTWSIFAVFIIFLVLVIIIKKPWKLQETQNNQPPDSVELVLPADILADLSEISYKYSNGDLLVITRKTTGDWSISSEPQTEVSTSRMSELIANLESLEIVSKLKSPSNLSEVGLSPAIQEIIINNKKGNSLRVSIGNLTPTGSGYYLQIDNAIPIIVGKGGMETIFDLLSRENLRLSPTSAS
ncbi:MAG: DUF4340 domain-containing protein [Anaerolineaceae bacterium]